MKNTKWIISIVAVVLLFTGCNTPDLTDPQSELIDLKMKELSRADIQLESLTKGLAPVLLSDSKLLEILHDEIGKKFDGETEVLFSEYSKIIVEGTVTVHDYIKAKLDSAGENTGDGGNQYVDVDAVLENLDSLINLHINMPYYELWDSSMPFVLAYLPLTKDGDTIEQVTAYDCELASYTISKTNIMDYKLLILGPNERTDENKQLRSDVLVYKDGQLVTLGSPASRSPGFTREGAREYIQTINIYSAHEGGIGQGSPEFILYYKYGNENTQYDIEYKDKFDNKIGQPVPVNADLGPWDEKIKGTFLFISMVEDDPSFGLKVTIGAEAKKDILGITITGSASVTFEIGWGDDKLGNVCVDYRDESPKNYQSDAGHYNCTMFYIERELCKPDHPCVMYGPEGEVSSTMPLFEWEDTQGAEKFNVYVYRKDDNMLVGQVLDWIAASYVFPRPFKTGTCYYWMVEGTGRCGAGPMSDKMHFTVPAAIPQDVTPEFPKDSIMDSMPTFTWTSSFPESMYTLSIYRANDNSLVFQKTDIASTSYTITRALPANVNLYWTVSLSVMGEVNNTYVSVAQSFCTTATSTPEPTNEPTSEPTAEPTQNPGPEYTPEPNSLTVHWITQGEKRPESHVRTYTNVPFDTPIRIGTVSSFFVDEQPYYYLTETFVCWHVEYGSAMIDNPASSSTDVYNIQGDVTIKPEYR